MSKRYATIDADGAVLGFYADDIGALPPPEAIEISEEVWMDWGANQASRRWRNGALVTVEPVAITPPGMPQPTLADLQAQLNEIAARIAALSA